MDHNIAIIGSGVVGSATGKVFAQKGLSVTFADTDDSVLSILANEEYHVQDAKQRYLSDDHNLILVSVPTPTSPKGLEGRINLDYLQDTVTQIGKELKESPQGYPIVAIRSTVPPGTTESIERLLEQSSARKIGQDLGLCMNPEFMRAASAEADFANPQVTVVGTRDQRTKDALFNLYSSFGAEFLAVDYRTAESIKYWHNIANAFKISAFNEIAEVAVLVNGSPLKVRKGAQVSFLELKRTLFTSQTDSFTLNLQEIPENKLCSNSMYNTALQDVGLNIQYGKGDSKHWSGAYLELLSLAFAKEVDTFNNHLNINSLLVKNTIIKTAEAYRNPEYGTKGGEGGLPVAYGGSCLPKDTIGFFNYAKGKNVSLPFLRSIIETNEWAKDFKNRVPAPYFQARLTNR